MPQSLAGNVFVFTAAALVIAVAGYHLTGVAKSIAAASGLGQAILGGVLIGVITSLAGTVTSIKAASDGNVDIAFGNAVGGIAAQTVFLVVADLFYRKANLEHAAAAEVNLTQGTVLILLLAIALLATLFAHRVRTRLTVAAVSVGIVATYLVCVRLIARSHQAPMWHPRRTDATSREPPPAQTVRRTRVGEWLTFGMLVVFVAAMGWLVAHTAPVIASGSGLSDTVVGVVFTSVSTSLPELAVAVSAVRRGALNLALGDILGGNTFDVLFLSASDAAYRGGSIYHAVSDLQSIWIVLCIVMSAVLLLGLLRRQKRGIANIGIESGTIIVIYVVAVLLLFAGPG